MSADPDAMWNALDGVTLHRPPSYWEPRCFVCTRRGRRPGMATCSPRCNETWRRFLSRAMGPRPAATQTRADRPASEEQSQS